MKLNIRIGLFSIAVIAVIAGILLINYIVIRRSTDEMYRELEKTTEQAVVSVNNLLQGSIENYLRGIAEKNLEIVAHFHARHLQGEFSQAEAKRRARDVLLTQSIGSTGYLVAVESRPQGDRTQLTLVIHKHMPDGDCTNLAGCQGWESQKEGYNEYDWLNPGDPVPRKKAAFLKPFEPYRWVIGATTFKDELTNLINLATLKKAIKAVRINETGYLYVIDGQGKVIVHPELEGQNILDARDANGRAFAREIIAAKNGKITYDWRLANENIAHERYAHFRHIADLDWYLVATGYTAEANAAANKIRNIGILSLVAVGLLFAFAVAFAQISVVRPLRRLNEYVAMVKEGHYDIPQAVRSQDEIGTLASSFHDMAKDLGASFEERDRLLKEMKDKNILLEMFNERLESEVASKNAEIVRIEKLASLGAIVAGVSHEVNTPIGNALLVASTLKEETDEFTAAMQAGLRRSALDAFIDSARNAASIVVGNLERAARLITAFKRVAVDQTSSRQRDFFLDELIQDLVVTLRTTFKKTPYLIEFDVAPKLGLRSYPGPLDQALTNLINNAILHGFEGREHGKIRIVGRAAGENAVEITVSDDGRGIPPEYLDRIFDPFFSTRIGKGGSGLGLHIVRTLVAESLGGSVDVASLPDSGTTFTLRLPRQAPAAEEGKGATAPTAIPAIVPPNPAPATPQDAPSGRPTPAVGAPLTVEWTRKNEIGIPRIDFEHRIFADLINALSRQVTRGCDRLTLARNMRELQKYAEFHFVSEENLMTEFGYPEIGHHTAMHKQLIAELARESVSLANDELAPEALIDFLRRWFLHHTSVEDIKFAFYCRNSARVQDEES